MMQGMLIDMEEAWLQALAQVKIFLGGTAEMAFRVPKAERHRLIEPVRKRFGTARHGWAGTDVWLRDIERMTRLVRPYRKDGIAVEPAPRAPNHGFTPVLPPRTRPCWPKWLSVWHPGFHTNNGSESINYQVAGLLETLRVEFTTSRSRHSNDTAWRSPRTAQSCANIWALPKPATRRRSGQ